jgi:hypothetical protein
LPLLEAAKSSQDWEKFKNFFPKEI